jgi:hypothetical protein
MATLVSPGVSVMVTDESQYVAATQGTLPLVVVATAANKSDASGSAIAAGTLAQNAGVAYLVSSQRELVETFGEPKFYEVGGSVVQGAETSEYGLLAAYQYLGVSNNAYVIRADVDLAQLEASSNEPRGFVENGSYWLDVDDNDYGLFQYNGTDWSKVTPLVLNDEPGTGNVEQMNASGYASPKNTFGSANNFAVVTSTARITYWKKVSTDWILLGDIGSPDFQFAKFAPTTKSDGTNLAAGDLYVRLTVQGGGLDFHLGVYSSAAGGFVSLQVPAYHPTKMAWDSLGIPNVEGEIYLGVNQDDLGIMSLYRHDGRTETVVQGNRIVSDVFGDIVINGQTFTYGDIDNQVTIEQVVQNLQASVLLSSRNIKVELTANNALRFTHTLGHVLKVDFPSYNNQAFGFDEQYNSDSLWELLVFESNPMEPNGDIEEGTLWYNADLKMELLRAEYVNGEQQWVKYAWSEDNNGLTVNELQLRSAKPTKRKDGASPLVTGDIWVDGDAKPYPAIHRWNGSEWIKLDTADQSSTNGVIFGHYSYAAPFNENGDANLRTAHDKTPNAELYPEGMLMVNMDHSTYNVKKWVDGKWEWASGIELDGAGKFGAAAQRHMVVEAMQAALAGNEGIRAEATYFNLIAAPGYPELMDEMMGLNKDKKEIAFVVGDAPLHLKGDTTSIKNWADDNIPADAYAGIYYPHGLSTDLSGNDVVMPSSAIALRTIAFSDQVSYPWFAPAGLTRGVVTNASAVGYVNDENEFVRVRLSEGQRDVLYMNRMNPIADMPGTGLVVYGQKTLQSFASAMDRINVARLVNYMRYNLDQLSRGFLFEQNDKITRDNIRDAVERFCGTLVSERGLYDFLVVCDESNNTPARIDRNELWVDVAIQPVKSVEFIYIPLRIRNTGEEL